MTIVQLILNGVVLTVLFLLSAFFSGSETVLFSLSPVQVQRIKRRNPSAGARLERMLHSPSTILSTLLVGNSFVNFAIAGIGYLILDRLTPGFGEIIAVPLMTLMLLLFGEVTPKRIAINNAERFAPVCSRLVLFWEWILSPFSLVMGASSKIFKKALRRERQQLNDDEFLTAVKVSESQGVLDKEEASMVDGIMRLSELKASDEMIPRIDMIGIDLDEPMEDNLRVARSARHRYLPVYRRTPDAIEGFLDVVQFLLDQDHRIKEAIGPAMFVPENLSLDKLLVDFQSSSSHIACVLDEYGGTAGIITRGDILELVTAPVLPNGGQPVEEIKKIGNDTWLLAGTASIEEINHIANLELTADDSDRISGWITLHAERIPYPGMVIEAQGCRATVLAMRKRRVTSVRFKVLHRKEEDELEELLADDQGEEDDQ